MGLLITIMSSQGRICKKVVLKLGSGSDSSRVLRMKKTLEDAQERLKMLKGMEGVMMNEVGGGKKEVVCAQLSCGDPQVGLLVSAQIFLNV